MNKALGLLLPMLFTVCIVAICCARGAAATYTVQIVNFTYEPAVLKLHVGDSVVFVNRDPEAHTVTAKGRTPFDSGAIDYMKSWRITLYAVGTFRYFCEPHPYMTGTLVVAP